MHKYELELVLHGDASTTKNTIVQQASEAKAWVSTRIESNSILTVVRTDGSTDFGNFVIFNNADNIAYVRLLEHQGFYAKRAPTLAIDPPCSITFTSDVGSSFSVDQDSTVPVSVALEALNHWLSTGEATPLLAWCED